MDSETSKPPKEPDLTAKVVTVTYLDGEGVINIEKIDLRKLTPILDMIPTIQRRSRC